MIRDKNVGTYLTHNNRRIVHPMKKKANKPSSTVISWSNEEKHDPSLRSSQRNSGFNGTNELQKFSFDEFQTNGHILQPYLIRLRSRQGQKAGNEAKKKYEPPFDATFSNMTSQQHDTNYSNAYHNKAMGGTQRPAQNTPFQSYLAAMRQDQDKVTPRVMTTVQQDRRSSHIRAANMTRFKHFELQKLRQFSSIVPDRTLYEAPSNIEQLKILQVGPHK